MNSTSFSPVILCGGTGSRLWPLSRSSFPKQYLSLFDESKNSLLQETQSRLINLINIDSPIIICNEDHRFIVAEQMRGINIKPKSILLEPFGRNTAPAIISAALKGSEDGSDPTLLILSADHKIEDIDQFLEVINKARKYCEEGKIVTFGVVPTSPEIGYGYINASVPIESSLQAYPIEKFIEKPNLQTALELVKDKKNYWNSGIFMAKSSTLIAEADKYCIGLTSICKDSLDPNLLDLDFQRIKKETFKNCPNISIDKAIMEKTKIAMVIPFVAGWSDIGSWKTLWEVSKKDNNGNVFSGNIINQFTQNCLIKSDKKLVAAIGIKDLIIVDTNDAVLIVNKDDCQKVKDIVTHLKKIGSDVGTTHQTMYRPWGCYTSIAKGDKWQLKTIEVKPKAKLSLQMHKHRAEHWVVVKGTAEIEINNNKMILKENQSAYIPLGAKHRLSNPKNDLLMIVEVQSGDYLGEDDIVRFEDIYGRDK
tara:strand:- start:1403 stop:2839 length:1437 start_codon:yes stop_codon:yes gene_type:complete